MYEDKHYVVLLRAFYINNDGKERCLYRYVKKYLKKPNAIIKIDNKTYTVNFKLPTYIVKNNYYYFMDIDKGDQILSNIQAPIMNPDELDLLIGNHTIRDIVSGVSENTKDKFLYILAGALFGGLIGWLVCQNIMQSKIDALDSDNTNTITTLPTIGLNIWNILKMWLKLW